MKLYVYENESGIIWFHRERLKDEEAKCQGTTEIELGKLNKLPKINWAGLISDNPNGVKVLVKNNTMSEYIRAYLVEYDTAGINEQFGCPKTGMDKWSSSSDPDHLCWWNQCRLWEDEEELEDDDDLDEEDDDEEEE